MKKFLLSLILVFSLTTPSFAIVDAIAVPLVELVINVVGDTLLESEEEREAQKEQSQQSFKNIVGLDDENKTSSELEEIKNIMIN